jgi:biopolymer transport protein ExbD
MKRMRSRRAGFSKLHQHSGALTLTSMMDILTVLLIFILKSYVAGGDITIPPPGLQLPKSTVEHPMGASVVVAIDHNDILVGTERVASASDAAASREMVIEPLAERLRQARVQMDDLEKRTGAKPKPHVVTIQGDRNIEFKLLQKVMYTVNQSGFSDIALAVLQKS